MTFDEYWEKINTRDRENSCRYIAYKAWNAATAAERQRCREIVVKYADRLRDEGYRLLDTIADEIGE